MNLSLICPHCKDHAAISVTVNEMEACDYPDVWPCCQNVFTNDDMSLVQAEAFAEVNSAMIDSIYERHKDRQIDRMIYDKRTQTRNH